MIIKYNYSPNKIDLTMKYWQAKKLKQTEFKRLTGVKKNF